MDLPRSGFFFFLLNFDDNNVAGKAAPAHTHGDKAHSSLPWLIAVHVTPSEATLPLNYPSANFHLIMPICVWAQYVK